MVSFMNCAKFNLANIDVLSINLNSFEDEFNVLCITEIKITSCNLNFFVALLHTLNYEVQVNLGSALRDIALRSSS